MGKGAGNSHRKGSSGKKDKVGQRGREREKYRARVMDGNKDKGGRYWVKGRRGKEEGEGSETDREAEREGPRGWKAKGPRTDTWTVLTDKAVSLIPMPLPGREAREHTLHLTVHRLGSLDRRGKGRPLVKLTPHRETPIFPPLTPHPLPSSSFHPLSRAVCPPTHRSACVTVS